MSVIIAAAAIAVLLASFALYYWLSRGGRLTTLLGAVLLSVQIALVSVAAGTLINNWKIMALGSVAATLTGVLDYWASRLRHAKVKRTD